MTFVALGTSSLDIFSCRATALKEKYADRAVGIGSGIGNNSINVFLGFGLSWMIGSIYQYVNVRMTSRTAFQF